LSIAFVLGWNNSGLTTGNLSNLIKYNVSLVVTLAGIASGLVVEGQKMSHSIVGKFVTTRVSPAELVLACVVTLVLFLVLTIVKIPVSLSNCVVGSFAGVVLASGGSISVGFSAEIAASWIFAPFLCAGLAALIYELVIRGEGLFSLSSITWINRLTLVGGVFYISYALGANNLGFILSLVKVGAGAMSSNSTLTELEAALFVSLGVGTILFGRSIAKVVGDKIVGLTQIKTLSAILGAATMTWAFTQLAVPVSLTQLVIGGMLGAGLTRGPDVVNNHEVFVMVRDWILVTILCLFVGYATEWLISLLPP